jgi:hypothetical protein
LPNSTELHSGIEINRIREQQDSYASHYEEDDPEATVGVSNQQIRKKPRHESLESEDAKWRRCFKECTELCIQSIQTSIDASTRTILEALTPLTKLLAASLAAQQPSIPSRSNASHPVVSQMPIPSHFNVHSQSQEDPNIRHGLPVLLSSSNPLNTNCIL